MGLECQKWELLQYDAPPKSNFLDVRVSFHDLTTFKFE